MLSRKRCLFDFCSFLHRLSLFFGKTNSFQLWRCIRNSFERASLCGLSFYLFTHEREFVRFWRKLAGNFFLIFWGDVFGEISNWFRQSSLWTLFYPHLEDCDLSIPKRIISDDHFWLVAVSSPFTEPPAVLQCTLVQDYVFVCSKRLIYPCCSP